MFARLENLALAFAPAAISGMMVPVSLTYAGNALVAEGLAAFFAAATATLARAGQNFSREISHQTAPHIVPVRPVLGQQ